MFIPHLMWKAIVLALSKILEDSSVEVFTQTVLYKVSQWLHLQGELLRTAFCQPPQTRHQLKSNQVTT